MDNIQIKRSLFDHTIGLLQRSLDLRTFRHRILSDNVANSENPDFTPKEVSFQKVLQETMQGRSAGFIRTTHSHHLSGDVPGTVEVASSAEGIQLDQEMAKLAENNLMFQAGVQALLKKFEGIKTVIQEGGR
ncbi:MAG: flagellar basal body rod protein FlgB [Deltaproteobacteria bacterium]|nr:flagellar basal body rod protein FlgB [Deltaproteobacteria bacterium]